MLKAEWIDGNREPKCAPNPNYPVGIAIDASNGAPATCEIELAYPAPRIGQWVVTCSECGRTDVITTAGRPDDPRSYKTNCLLNKVTRQ